MAEKYHIDSKEVDEIQWKNFANNIVDSLSKTTDKLDLFEKDGWLSTMQFGKLASFIVEKIVEKSPKEGFNHAIGLSCVLALDRGLKNNGLSSLYLPSGIKKAKDQTLVNMMKSDTANLVDFDLADFWNCSPVRPFSEYFENLIKRIENKKRIRIKGDLQEWSPIFFTSLLENTSLKYSQLNKTLNSKTFKSLKDKGALDKYRIQLLNFYNEKISLEKTKTILLSQIYVEPSFHIFEKCLNFNDKRNTYQHPFLPSSFIDIGYEKPLYNFILDWYDNNSIKIDCFYKKNPRLILLYGYPGQGKTSFCKRLLNGILAENLLKNVFYIKLDMIRDVKNFSEDPLSEIREYLDKTDKLNITASTLEKSFLILDGLDELRMMKGLDNETIELIIKQLTHECKHNNGLKILITSRYGYVNLKEVYPKRILIFQLSEFDKEQQKNWLKKYQDLFNLKEKPILQKIEKIINFQHKEGIGNILKQPVLLHLIASLDDVDIEAKSIEVYEEIFNQIDNPIWKEEQINALAGIEKTEIRQFIRALAFKMFKKENYDKLGYLHKTEIDEMKATKQFKEHLNVPFYSVLKTLLLTFYFQEVYSDNNDYAISFLHKSILDLLLRY